jgi:hypothetical protein
LNYNGLAGSGEGVRFRFEVDRDGSSKTDKIAESEGLRGAVVMPEGGGRETGMGDGMAGGTF